MVPSGADIGTTFMTDDALAAALYELFCRDTLVQAGVVKATDPCISVNHYYACQLEHYWQTLARVSAFSAPDAFDRLFLQALRIAV